MPLLLPLLPLIAQVGPFTHGKDGADFPARPARSVSQAAALDVLPPGSSAAVRHCADAVEADPDQALDLAEAWLARAKGKEAAEAQLCVGLAQSGLENWEAAEQAFLAGREGAGSDRLERARLGSMAANAALAANAPARALAALDGAAADAKGLAAPALEADIALDRARALVALNRPDEAEAALAAARAASPGNAEAWLLSATLARREGHLAEAQTRIQKAAELLPVDPEIGLEAGVIAVLAGRDAAARKSWESVIAAAPASPAAQSAKSYLAQLGPAPSAAAAKP